MLVGTNASRAGYESARLELARLRLSGGDARATAMRQIAQTAARALGAERVGIWAFKGAGGGLVGVCQFDLRTGTFPPAGLPDGLAPPALLAEIQECRVIAIADARADARTSPLGKDYLDLHGIASLMAAPVIRGGNVVGVICCEQVGVVRDWTVEDRDFGACAADMAALFLEQADRLDAEASLRTRREEEAVDERMAALGRLARSVAHDVNNVLGAIDLIGATLEAGGAPDAAARGREVRAAVAFGARLVQHLVSFGRQAAPPAEEVELGGFLRHVEPVLRGLIRGARLQIDVSTREEAMVVVDRAELKQLVLNLCVNAGEAMSPGGLVRIALRDPEPGEALDGPSVVLVVADDGCGMNADTMAHMYEPYFTTKPGGLGIGLSTVYGIVKRAGGTILVDSAVGKGTSFRVVLPRARTSPEPRRAPQIGRTRNRARR